MKGGPGREQSQAPGVGRPHAAESLGLGLDLSKGMLELLGVRGEEEYQAQRREAGSGSHGPLEGH